MDGETLSGSGAKCMGDSTRLKGWVSWGVNLHGLRHYKEEVATRERERDVGGGKGWEQGIFLQ